MKVILIFQHVLRKIYELSVLLICNVTTRRRTCCFQSIRLSLNILSGGINPFESTSSRIQYTTVVNVQSASHGEPEAIFIHGP